MFRKRRVATPQFGHTPWNPIQGENANLRQDGTSPFCAMVQIAAADDTYDDYVICRGFDPRILKFIDYAVGDADKPGISVAKPFGKRKTGTYEIGEVYPALLPTQGNAGFQDFRQTVYVPPSPVAVKWRVGQNPGVTTGGLDGGQPANLTDEIGILHDHNNKVVNWLLIDSNGGDNRIEFWVDSATTISNTASPYNGMRELTVTIVGPDCGHASTMGDTSIKVYDHLGRLGLQNFTNGETDAALVDRTGYAYKGVFQDKSTGAAVGAKTPCHWVLDGLLCP